MKSIRFVGAIVLALACIPLVSTPARAGDDWLPIDPSQLGMTKPVVEPDADAEAIFWDVRLQDQESGSTLRSVLTHYIRVKVYTDRGKEMESKIDITYTNRTKISDIAARTIKADGTIVELKSDAIFDREIVKAGRLKVKAKSFAVPAVEPGAIVEYRWKESRPFSGYVRLPFQRDIPIQKVVYHVKPFSNPNFPYAMRSQSFHCQHTDFVKESGGFYMTSLSNVKAFREEPYMPPEDSVRAWMLIFYSEDTKLTADKFWTDYGKRVYDRSKNFLKVNDDIRKRVPEIVGDASTPEQKLERIYEFCRHQIKNTSDDASGLTDDDRENLKENKQPSDTLKRGQGTGLDITFLFGALCNAAGLDARVALLPDRGDFFFDPSFPDDYFISDADIAVKIGEDWRVLDPARTYVPYGMLLWQQEGVQTLVTDPKDPIFIQTPTSAPDKSKEKRTATLKLADDGTLEGDVHIEYTGHLAVENKEYNDDDSPEKREQTVRDGVKERLSTAEVSDIKVENVTDPDKPFSVSYHIKVPGYAQRTGKRLFLQPAFFQHNETPMLQAASRHFMVYFHYPWSEEDDVTIELPEGFKLDSADAPESFGVGNVGSYDVKILAAKDGSLLEFQRKFFFGGDGSLYFPTAGYEKLKLVFDTVHERDGHTITLKQEAAQ